MIRPFQLSHLSMMEPSEEFDGFSPSIMAHQLEQSVGLTMFMEGRPVYCAGVIELTPGRYLATALFDRAAGKYLLPILRATRVFYDTFDYNRVEAIVACELPQALRFAELSGFEVEAPRMRNFHGGRDYALYARVK